MFKYSIMPCIAISLMFLMNSAEYRHEVKIDNVTIIIEKGDITRTGTEAIVNAANAQLKGGAGVCGAIFAAAGSQKLQEACDQFPQQNGDIRCPIGSACMTPSFALENQGTRYIIHAVGPDCRIISNRDEQKMLLHKTYRSALELVVRYNIASISFPFISSGIYQCDPDLAALSALESTRDFIRLHHNALSLREVRFVLFSDKDFALFVKHVRSALQTSCQ